MTETVRSLSTDSIIEQSPLLDASGCSIEYEFCSKKKKHDHEKDAGEKRHQRDAKVDE